MRYNVHNLSTEYQQAVEEFSQFDLDKNGCSIEQTDGQNFVAFDGKTLKISCTSKARFIYSLFLFDALGKTGDTGCDFENLLAMVDMSRNAVRTIATVKKYMKMLVLMGYTGIQLYMEDVYEIPEEPYFGYKRGRYSQSELKEIVAYAKRIGLQCVPAIQTLAHIPGITRWRRFAGSVIDTDDILLVDEEQTYALIEKMFKTLRECFDTEEINIGMDEAYRVGLGKYLNIHGYTDRATIIVRHLQRVVSIAEQYGFTKPMIWNDMFVRLANKGDYLNAVNAEIPEEILRMIPENLTLACWNYYNLDREFYKNMLTMQKKFHRPLYYVSGAISWLGVTPMNKFSIKQNTVAMEVCREMQIKNYMITVWGDDGAECSLFATLPTVAYTAAMANRTLQENERLFQKITGIEFENFLLLDTPNEITTPAPMFSISQPSKYMLYNDCLLGLYDSTITQGDGEKFAKIAENLQPFTQSGEWGYLFQTMQALAQTLYYKYELTAKTRKAYQNKDKQALRSIVEEDYQAVLNGIERFYEALRRQWYQENKSYGFEEMDYRLGGLRQRVAHCRQILTAYLSGEIEKIDELEGEVLSVVCNEEMDGKGVDARSFREVMTVRL